MVFNTFLSNTQYYKVLIKDKEVQSTEKVMSSPTLRLYVEVIFINFICSNELVEVIWNEPPQALASMSMHTKLNISAIIKELTLPH